MTCDPETILSSVYQDAQSQLSDQRLPSALNDLLQMMVRHAENQKAVLGALITVLVYKICHPEQDIRYHQERMLNGYSARTFDTKYVTPFVKVYFPRYAMRESAWLTRSIEQPHPFTSDFPGRIRNADVKKAFLTLIDAVQANAALAQPTLTALFRFLLAQSAEDTPSVTSPSGDISIDRVVSRFQRHLDHTLDKSGTARLPVLAI
jgi:DNA (cytosine-5)-methyltransferase 1